jgi:hypothetical protein
MEKTVIGLVAALGAAAPLSGAQAAVMTADEANNALRASSLAELLEPAPNALAVLAALDANQAPKTAEAEKGVQVAQWNYHHHHHHHHHHWYHHHNNWGWGGGWGGGWGHHHHHHYWRWCYYHPYAPQCY